MKISVQDNMKDMYTTLKVMGYDVHYLREKIVSDVYIYSGNSDSINSIYSGVFPSENGCLIINSDNKGVEDIIYSIEHRTYTPLF